MHLRSFNDDASRGSFFDACKSLGSDRCTGLLLAGDSLYPGRLYVNESNLPLYAASARRLAEFARAHPIAHVLGTHIEQSQTPYVNYPRGTTYQPEEHSLELSRAHVLELDDAFARRKEGAESIALPDFTISVRPGRQARNPSQYPAA
jgi:hydroxyacylglutathione hydrolase